MNYNSYGSAFLGIIRGTVLVCLVMCIAVTSVIANDDSEKAQNPIIWADVPDPSVLRVGDTYYMSSTTMHMNPGVPIMKSYDLANWEIVNYAYDTLADSDALALRNGHDAYGSGSWASSLKYHDGTYYVSTFSYSTGRTHVYTTDDIEDGEWTEHILNRTYHDMSMYFEDDRLFMVHGSDNIRIVELEPDLSGVKSGGLDEIIIDSAGSITAPIGENSHYVRAEGAHIHFIDDMYYIFLISWPQVGMRTQLVFRSDSLTGPYEGKIVLQDSGIAQGGLIDTPEGDWYAMLFQDHGAVGRIPHLIPVEWEDGWPVFGSNGNAPSELDIPAGDASISGIVDSDEFERNDGDRDLPLVWQWNHNPVDEYWSISDRPGYLRLTNGRIDNALHETQNTLTQRTFGPQSSANTAVDISNMNDGDFAGLSVFQANYGFAGVKKEDGETSIVLKRASVSTDEDSGERIITIHEVSSEPLEQDIIYLRADVEYRNRADRAIFYYSLDGNEWTSFGFRNALNMTYSVPYHFMGYRFALFNFATQSTGGYVDFEYFRIARNNDDYQETETSYSENSQNDKPGEFKIWSNYPNPFNPATKIRYNVAEYSNVEITVYDVTGRQVTTLVNEMKTPGEYSVSFDAVNLASGVYLYRMQAGNFVQTQQMMLIK